MPELPDLELYLACLRRRVEGVRVQRLRLTSPFLLRTADPPPAELAGRAVRGLERLGKRLVLAFEGDLFAVLHLMVAGRLRWEAAGAAIPGRLGLAAFDFDSGTLLVTEAGTKKRASLHLVRGRAELAAHDRGGLEPLEADAAAFAAALARENHTLKRALTDPRLFAGIGNAYSDEILHRARLSPLQWTRNLAPEEAARLHAATQAVLRGWRDRLIAEAGEGWPKKVTAFREGMAVHGRFRQPCPDCGAPVQRIVRAENESNYCARCQTGGRLLADRALSRLLGKDWPRSLDEL
ncbi:MAG: formamidopyrimidine-DNA glycosylase [Acidobacteria bacterium]|nr:formamidopyrimidine-DNA glycosylase [Acidobacteriota bacterium]MCU0254743.1 formamidopyrimidine-DNA glycosylase [Acidobacteriota bacterium]